MAVGADLQLLSRPPRSYKKDKFSGFIHKTGRSCTRVWLGDWLDYPGGHDFADSVIVMNQTSNFISAINIFVRVVGEDDCISLDPQCRHAGTV